MAPNRRDRAWRREAIARAPLLAIVGEPARGRDALAIARAAIAGGVRFLELRLKGRPKGEVYAAARALAALCAETGALLVVNDDADVAAAAGADGVHVGQEDLPPEAARRVVGPEAIVGLSVHDLGEAARAREASSGAGGGPGAIDYAGVGTFFASPLKPDLRARGPAELAPVVAALGGLGAPAEARGAGLWVYAIGGLTARNAAEALATGAHGLAVGSAIAEADDPAAAARELLSAIRAASGRPRRPPSP